MYSNLYDENTIIIGDGNWDCDYYDREEENHFADWEWRPRDDEDTTSGNTFCAYDRAIINEAMWPEIRSYAIYTEGIIPGGVDEGGRSDHYMIEVEIEPLDR